MTDTINTYGNPRADAPHEWQRPAPEVTPASLRAHADWMDGDDGQAWEGSRALRLRAARLEAESARDEYWLGIAMDVAKVWHPDGWDECGTDERQRLLEAVSVVEANLAADGRLLPEGGVGSDSCDRYLDGYYCTCAGPKPSGWVCCAKCLDAPPAASVPDSGPDGTPEKPWPTWQDAPEGVSYAGHNDPTGEGGVWRNTPGGRVFQTGLGGAWRHSAMSDSSLQGLAPFVRVDGEQK